MRRLAGLELREVCVECPQRLGALESLLRYFYYGRQPHRERRPLPVDALHGQVAAHQPAEVAADRQPQPGPAVPGPGGGLGLGERLEQLTQLLLRQQLGPVGAVVQVEVRVRPP
jgi:hypothetical protein